MRKGPGDILLVLGTVVACLAIYHWVVVSPPTVPGAASTNELADLERRVAALEGGAEAAPILDGRGRGDSLRRLEVRLEALEAQSATTGAAGTPEPRPRTWWRDEEVAALREGLRRVAAQDQRERETRSFAAQVANVATESGATERERAVGLLMAYVDAARALSPDPNGPPPTPQERQELGRRTEALRRQLEQDLRAVLPDDAAEKLAAAAPGGWPPAGSTSR